MKNVFTFKRMLVKIFAASCFFYLVSCSSSSTLIQRMSITPQRLAQQAIQSRTYATNNLTDILRAVAMVMQDQHYTIREVNVHLGTIIADQTNELGRPLEIFGTPLTYFDSPNYPIVDFTFGAPFFSFGPDPDLPYVQRQLSSAFAIVYPNEEKQGSTLRLTFSARSFLNNGQLAKVWTIDKPLMYQNFFNDVTKALYLQGSKIK
ncbi:hypothetical protein COMNV_00774 [Commensalibacter sp. Nvir]|uniref:hypothetical protein n=1 Tax=Commensalibacter sp. Nvir TaxID=3069817 RepID=UPI002D5404F1|nr:hypothetical protein COMNV_00774 [Commensalibacter sp. Nvir]